MTPELWIVLIIATAVAAALAGALWAKRRAPQQSEVDGLNSQVAGLNAELAGVTAEVVGLKSEIDGQKAALEAAHGEADAVQTNVSNHFERSALLFGKLAQDYRAFLEHFSESAQQLGLSEITARELLERADQPLLGHAAQVIEAAAQQEAAQQEVTQQKATQQEATQEEAAQQTGTQEEVEPPLIEDIVDHTGTLAAAEEKPRVVDVSLPEAEAAPVAAENTTDTKQAGLR